MEKQADDRRIGRRYTVHLPLHYRVSEKGVMARQGTGTTRDMSTNGLSFRCRRSLPVGAHIEIIIDWPARLADSYPVDLQLTGFVVRSEGGRVAVRITSRRFRAFDAQAERYRATA
jgi:hypothetical protein